MRLAAAVTLLLAAVAVLATTSNAKPTLSVLSAHANIAFGEAGPIDASHVSSVISSVLGLENTQSDFHWDGLKVGNSLKHPRAAALITVIGHDSTELPVIKSAAPSYEVKPNQQDASKTLQDLLSGAARGGQLNVASLLSKASASKAETIAVSHNHAIARLAGAVNGGSNDHVISSSSAEAVQAALVDGVFGPSVVLEANQQLFFADFGASGISLSMATGSPVAAYVAELVSMIQAAQSLAAARKPAAFVSMVVSTWTAAAASVSSSNPDALLALDLLLEATIESVSASILKAFPSNAVIMVVSLPDHQDVSDASEAAAAAVHRRDLSSVSATSKINSTLAYQCSSYLCHCNRASDGTYFDVTSGCVANDICTSNKNSPKCECAFHPCSCDSPYAIQSVCVGCNKGYVIQNGVCYVDSYYPAMVNIWLWIGLTIILALIATCYVLGEMDPGRNSVIYRMTSSHKTRTA